MFDHLIGNNAVKDAIRRYISNRRVPNSMLFAGPEGVGKKQFALGLARAIVCHDPIEHEGCGKCTACVRVEVFKFPPADDKDQHKKVIFSEHADVGQVIPFGRNVLVDAIRDLEREANFRPFEAPARVFVIDDAHKMNDSASNALLKTLEEPPTTSHIFLITSKPNALLPTIRSRVQTLRFGPVDASEIEHLLLTTHEYSQPDARLVAASANGSVALALSVDAAEFRAHQAEALEILRSAVIHRDVVDALKRSEKLGGIKSTAEFEAFLDILQSLIHRVWTARLGRDQSEDEDIQTLAAQSDPDRLADWIIQIEEVRANLTVNINKKIASDALLVRMATG